MPVLEDDPSLRKPVCEMMSRNATPSLLLQHKAEGNVLMLWVQSKEKKKKVTRKQNLKIRVQKTEWF